MKLLAFFHMYHMGWGFERGTAAPRAELDLQGRMD